MISVWQKILTDLEDCRPGTLLTAIDYAKEFNRMDFQHCLKTFARHGASSDVIKLIATFLTDRVMTVRVGNCWSDKRSVTQGSILRVLLFNMTMDNLNNDELDDNTTQLARLDVSTDDPMPADTSVCSSSFNTPARRSTPIPGSQTPNEPKITPFRKGSNRFVFLDTARNTRRALRYDLDLTMLNDQTLPPEPSPVTSAVWRPRKVGCHKYIDDKILDDKLNFETVTATDDGSTQKKEKHAIATQNTFRRIVRNAEQIGMKVNTNKTNQICISDAISFKASAHILTSDGEKITPNDTLKQLGFTFGPRPNCAAHVDIIRRSFRGRYWFIIHMKQHHYTEEELIKAYTTLIRPIVEYCVLVFHSMLTDSQDFFSSREPRIKHAVQSQNGFRHLVRKAKDIGIVVNTQKTTMVCISDAAAYVADTFILDTDQDWIGCKDSFKALGMCFSNKPNVDAQVKFVCAFKAVDSE